MRLSYVLLALPLAFNSVHAEEAKTDAAAPATITEKILSQGVPAPAFQMLVDYMKEHHGQEFLEEVYGCPTYVKEEEPTKEPAKLVKEEAKAPEAKKAETETAKTDEVKKSETSAAAAATAAPVVASKETKPATEAKADKKSTKPAEKPKAKVKYREVAPTEPTVKPCEDNKRVKMTKKVKFDAPTWVAIVDFSLPSTSRRFFLINMKTGEVQKYYTAHGKGSGNSNYATKFSNRKDSLQTSLGFYVTGDTYQGSYGDTLRLYGLQRSNDQAFNRDIVVHGAWYVGEDFINSINSQTKQKYGRLGVSWGCPALGLGVAPKVIGMLKGGSVLLHYHPDLMEKAQSGREVSVPAPVETPVVTAPAPAAPSTSQPTPPSEATQTPATTTTPHAGTDVAETSSESKTSAPAAGSN